MNKLKNYSKKIYHLSLLFLIFNCTYYIMQSYLYYQIKTIRFMYVTLNRILNIFYNSYNVFVCIDVRVGVCI